jgi:hypothetical protein
MPFDLGNLASDRIKGARRHHEHRHVDKKPATAIATTTPDWRSKVPDVSRLHSPPTSGRSADRSRGSADWAARSSATAPAPKHETPPAPIDRHNEHLNRAEPRMSKRKNAVSDAGHDRHPDKERQLKLPVAQRRRGTQRLTTHTRLPEVHRGASRQIAPVTVRNPADRARLAATQKGS